MGTAQSKTEEFKRILEMKILESMYPPPDAKLIKTVCRRPKKSAPQNIQRITMRALPIDGEYEKVVNARDGRKQVWTTNKWPESVHGLVSMRFKNDPKNDICWGTGTLIGLNIVLTAGHNLYCHKRKAYADLGSVKFVPGMNGSVTPFGSVEVEQYFVSPNFLKEEKEDYGILILKEPIGEVTGFFGLACLEPEEIKEKRINVTGYPSDKVASKPCIYEMWGMEGTANEIIQDRGLIRYLIDTGAGQSGSSVWYQEGEDYYICGVHVKGDEIVNEATLLTRAMYRQIYIWLQQTSFMKSHLALGEAKFLEIIFCEEINTECMSILMNYNLNNLTTLKIAQSRLEDEATEILARNISWVNLSHLDLARNQISPEGARKLAQNISWINLSSLNLSLNYIGAEGAKALAQNTSWRKLSHLNLSWNNIGTEGAKELARNTSWINLSQLNLLWNSIGSEGVKELAQNISWINLSILDLSYNKIDVEGAKALAQNTSWINLSQLYLHRNFYGLERAQAYEQYTVWASFFYRIFLFLTKKEIDLVLSTTWKEISDFNLHKNKIDEVGAVALNQNKTWKDIKIFRRTQLDQEEV